MPRGRTQKDKRKNQHVEASARSRGGGRARRVKEIAVRTVDKARRMRGRTPSRRTQGTGNARMPLADRTRAELYNMARRMKIPGRSSMNKGQLVRALRRLS